MLCVESHFLANVPEGQGNNIAKVVVGHGLN